MKKILITLAALTLSGCAIVPAHKGYVESNLVIGFYDPAYGYWNGYGWDTRRYYGYTYRLRRPHREEERNNGKH